MGGGMTSKSFRDDAKLRVYTPTADTWSTMDTPTYHFALVIYHSQLVLVGGIKYVGERLGPLTNKLWSLSECGNWEETLPPMITKRHSASAVSRGDHLLVAGGTTFDPLDVVEVFVYSDHRWVNTQPLPIPCQNMKSVVFNGYWYLMGGSRDQNVYFVSLDLLIASCQPLGETSYEWKKLPGVLHGQFSPAVFGNRLTVVVGDCITQPNSAVLAYSPSIESWVHVGNVPLIGDSSTCTIGLPTGELIVIGSDNHIIVNLKGMIVLVCQFFKSGRMDCIIVTSPYTYMYVYEMTPI